MNYWNLGVDIILDSFRVRGDEHLISGPWVNREDGVGFFDALCFIGMEEREKSREMKGQKLETASDERKRHPNNIF